MARRRQTTNNTPPLGPLTVVSRHYGDIHLNAWQDFASVEPESSAFAGLNSRLADQLRTLFSAPPPADRTVPCIIQGDVVHKRGVITPEVGWAVSTWLMKLREQHDRVLIFPGNHDYPLKAGAQWVHALSPFIPFGLGGIEIIDTPAIVNLSGDTKLYIVPWMPDIEDWRQAVGEMAEAASQSTGYAILSTHIAVQGGRMANGHAYTGRGATEADLHGEVFDQVLLSDFHARQQLAANIHYIGSPMQHHWGDAGDTSKGYAEVHACPGADGLCVSFIDLNGPRFYEVRDDMERAERLRAQGHYVRVVSDDTSVLNVAAEAGMATVREVPPPPETRIQLRPGSRPKDVLIAYFEQDQYQGDLDSGELMKLGASLLDDTDSNNEQVAGAMQLLRVKAVNFLSYDLLDAPLDNRGVVLLDGVNEDDPDADSNGAGKSAVIEAIVAALYGQTLRDISVGEWVKRGKRFGYVQVWVMTPRGELVITRNRNCPDLPSGLSVTLAGERIDSTARDFQNQLDEILGMDCKTFVQVAVFGQEVPRVFAEESDAVRKELLESLCGGEQFDIPYTHTKEVWETIKRQVADYAVRLLELDRRITHLTQDVERLTGERDGWAELQQERLRQERMILRDREAQLREKEAELAATAELLTMVQRSMAEMGDNVVTLACDADNRLTNAQRPLDNATRALHRAEMEVERAEESLRRFDEAEAEGAPVCPTCGQNFPSTSTPEERRTQYEIELKTAQSTLARCRNEVASLTTVRDRVREEGVVARAALDQYRELEAQSTSHRNVIRLQTAGRDQLQRDVETARRRIDTVEAEENRYVTLLQDKEMELATARQDKERVEADKAGAEGVIPYLEECVRLFGNQGLKTFLFDSLAPQITNEANRALSILSGGSLSVAVTTERRGRSEKIVLQVDNERGAPSFGGNSGGQKRKVNLALCWAIASLAEGRVNVLFIDEAFDSLDSTAGLRVCDLLEAREQETGTIIVTSHRSEFREAFPVVWTARRSGGNSVLEIP